MTLSRVLNLIPTNDQTRDVIVLGGSIDEFVEILHDVRERVRKSFPAGDLQHRQESCLSKFSLLFGGLTSVTTRNPDILILRRHPTAEVLTIGVDNASCTKYDSIVRV